MSKLQTDWNIDLQQRVTDNIGVTSIQPKVIECAMAVQGHPGSLISAPIESTYELGISNQYQP